MQYTVHAHPKSKQPRILERAPGVFDIYVSEVPDNGKANEAILKDLAGYLDVAPSRLVLKRGHTSRIKIIQVL